jgi:HEPN domain-containing protein
MYDKLYKAAKLDLESVKILNDNDLYAPAIYHCAQAIEKCSKAIHAYYMIKLQHVSRHDVGDKLRKKYGHNLLEPQEQLSNLCSSCILRVKLVKTEKKES